MHVAFNYVVRGGQRVRKDTKTHQDRWLAIDPDTCALVATCLDETRAALAAVGVELPDDAFLFSNDPAHSRPWNPDRGTHQIAAAADAARVELDIKGGRHYTASQLLAGGFDLRNTAARLGQRGRRNHAAALRRPSPRGRPASRRLPRTTDRQIYPVISSALTCAMQMCTRGLPILVPQAPCPSRPARIARRLLVRFHDAAGCYPARLVRRLESVSWPGWPPSPTRCGRGPLPAPTGSLPRRAAACTLTRCARRPGGW